MREVLIKLVYFRVKLRCVCVFVVRIPLMCGVQLPGSN